MASDSKRKLALRKVAANASARNGRTSARERAELKRTPEGRFFFGSQWTPEQLSEMERPDGLITLDPVILNRIKSLRFQ